MGLTRRGNDLTATSDLDFRGTRYGKVLAAMQSFRLSPHAKRLIDRAVESAYQAAKYQGSALADEARIASTKSHAEWIATVKREAVLTYARRTCMALPPEMGDLERALSHLLFLSGAEAPEEGVLRVAARATYTAMRTIEKATPPNETRHP